LKKQEEATPPQPTPMEKCIAEKVAQGMSQEEATTACKAELEAEQTPPSSEEKGLVQKIEAVITEAMEAKFKVLEKRIETRMAAIVKDKEDEAVKALRKGLGLEQDPVVHLSEIEGMVRKIVLDEEPHGKRTETQTPDKPTEGIDLAKSKVPKAEDTFNKLLEQKTVI
jgi:hypothetical protein